MSNHVAFRMLCLTTIFLVAAKAEVVGEAGGKGRFARELVDSWRSTSGGADGQGSRNLMTGQKVVKNIEAVSFKVNRGPVIVKEQEFVTYTYNQVSLTQSSIKSSSFKGSQLNFNQITTLNNVGLTAGESKITKTFSLESGAARKQALEKLKSPQFSITKSMSFTPQASVKNTLDAKQTLEQLQLSESTRARLKTVNLQNPRVDLVINNIVIEQPLPQNKQNSDEVIDEFLQRQESVTALSNNVALGLERCVDSTPSTFQADIKVIDSIWEICDPVSIQDVVNTEPKDISGRIPLHSWVDMFFATAFLKSGEPDAGSVIASIKRSRDSHVADLTKFITTLEGFRDDRIHVYGTTYLDIRLRHLINVIRRFLGLPVIAEAAVPDGYAKWATSLKVETADTVDIQRMAEILSLDFSLNEKTTTQVIEDLLKLESADNPTRTANLKAKIAVWTKFEAVKAPLKLELCKLAEQILFLYAGEPSMDSSQSRIADDKDDVERLAQSASMELAQNYFDNFRYLLDKAYRPAGCGTGGATTLQETIQYARISKIVTTFTSITGSTALFNDFFFQYILGQVDQSYKVYIESDFLLIRSDWAVSPLMELLRLSKYRYAFHAEFFQDIYTSKFQLLGDDKKTGVSYTYNYQSMGKYLAYLNSGNSSGMEHEDVDYHFSQVIIYLYKIYIIVRSDPSFKITGTSTLVEIYTAMYQFLFMKLEDYSGIIERGHFSKYYTTIITFLCSKLPANFCEEKKDSFNQQWENVIIDPNVDPTPGKIKIKVYIITYIMKIITTIKRKLELQTWVTEWEALGWENVECDNPEVKQVFEHKSVVKSLNDKGELVNVEKDRIYWIFTDKCTDDIYAKVEEHIRKFLIKWDKNEFAEWWITFMGIYKSSDRFRLELIRYILIRIVRTYISNTFDIKASRHMFSFIIHLLHYYEEQLLGNLNYFKTAGFYGFFDMLTNSFEAGGKAFEAYFDINQFDSYMVRFDHYYLTFMAYLQTPLNGLEPSKKKLWDVNTEYMLLHLPRHFPRLYNSKEEKGNFDSFHMDVMKCRKFNFEITTAKGVSSATEQECASLNEQGQVEDATDTRKGKCVRKLNLFTDCNTKFLLQQLNYVLTSHIMVQSVVIFNHYNYFHPYFVVANPGQGNEVEHSAFVKDIRNRRFFVSTYKQLQLIRLNLEGQIDNVPEYAMNKILECAKQDLIYTNTVTNMNSLCRFSPSLYGNMFWVWRHAFIVNYGGHSFNLDSWMSDVAPLGTLNFFLLVTHVPAMSNDLDGLCDENEDVGQVPDICKIKDLIDFWISETSSNDAIDPSEGIAAIEGVFEFKKISDARQVAIKEAKDRMSVISGAEVRSKFLLLEAFYVMSIILKKNQAGISRVKSSMNVNYKSDDDGFNAFYKLAKAFEWSDNSKAEEVKMMSQFLRFTFRKTTVEDNEKNLRQTLATLVKSKDVAFIDDYFTSNNVKSVGMVYLLARYLNTNEEYTMLSQLLQNRKQFLDAVLVELKKDVALRLIGGMNGCGSTPMAECLYGLIQKIEFENLSSSRFEIERATQDLGDFALMDFSKTSSGINSRSLTDYQQKTMMGRGIKLEGEVRKGIKIGMTTDQTVDTYYVIEQQTEEVQQIRIDISEFQIKMEEETTVQVTGQPVVQVTEQPVVQKKAGGLRPQKKAITNREKRGDQTVPLPKLQGKMEFDAEDPQYFTSKDSKVSGGQATLGDNQKLQQGNLMITTLKGLSQPRNNELASVTDAISQSMSIKREKQNLEEVGYNDNFKTIQDGIGAKILELQSTFGETSTDLVDREVKGSSKGTKNAATADRRRKLELKNMLRE